MRARLLDISRLASRVGTGSMTGIDRVERAYFAELLNSAEPVFFLVRVTKGYVVLDRAGGKAVLSKLQDKTMWGPRDIISRLSTRLTHAQQQCESDLRRHSIGKCLAGGLPRLLSALFPDGATYFNVGHSNLRHDVFFALKNLPHSRIIVLIHDVIPLTYPQYSRLEIVMRFEQDLRRVSRHADLIIYNSQCTKVETEEYFAKWDRIPKSVVAHLGTESYIAKVGQHIVNKDEKSSFVCLGTIEPRKNHQLLLDIWKGFHKRLPVSDIPTLHIIGRRGWNNDNIFNILDIDPMMNVTVFEHKNMADAAVQEHLAQCQGLLFPSFAEGFGLPLIEAAQLGVPIICGENAIYREILGDYPLYLNVDNSYLWANRILDRAGRKRESEAEKQARANSVSLPSWKSHFDQIFRFV